MAEISRTFNTKAKLIVVSRFDNIELNVFPSEGSDTTVEVVADESVINSLGVEEYGSVWKIQEPESQNNSVTIIGNTVVNGDLILGRVIKVKGTYIENQYGPAKESDKDTYIENYYGPDRELEPKKLISKKPALVKVTIRLSKQASLKLRKVMGDIVIGEIDNSLDLAVDGDTTVSAQSVGDLKLVAESGSVLLLHKCLGKHLSVRTEGGSSVRILAGEVENLKARTEGGSKFIFKGKATNADLRSEGGSELSVSRVTNKPHVKREGDSSLTVENWK